LFLNLRTNVQELNVDKSILLVGTTIN